MKPNTNKLSFRTVVVVVLAVIALSASLYGCNKCYEVKNGTEIVYVDKCSCPCEKYGRDSKGRCVECGHYVDVEPVQIN